MHPHWTMIDASNLRELHHIEMLMDYLNFQTSHFMLGLKKIRTFNIQK